MTGTVLVILLGIALGCAYYFYEIRRMRAQLEWNRYCRALDLVGSMRDLPTAQRALAKKLVEEESRFGTLESTQRLAEGMHHVIGGSRP